MRIHSLRARSDEESGAYAILFAILVVMFFGFAAFAVDIANHVDTRQDLRDTLDAAAHAGATFLPDDPNGARAAAISYAHTNDPELVGDPQVIFWCIVAEVNGAPKLVQLGVVCDPGPFLSESVHCSGVTCAIPCDPFIPGRRCNAVQVLDDKTVPYAFAPAIGKNEGSTGALDGAACKGNCGADITGPIDLVLVLDRTPSMRDSDIVALVGATRVLLEQLEPSKHHVGLVVHGPSIDENGCPTTGVAQDLDSPDFPLNDDSSWVAVGLSTDYDPTDNFPPDDPPALASGEDSRLIAGLDCLDQSHFGTDLGDPLLAAAQHLDAHGRSGVPKAILMMSDGQPTLPNGTGAVTSIPDCAHSVNSAAQAKDLLEVTIITVAYRLQGTTALCPAGWELLWATSMLATMASDVGTLPSLDQTAIQIGGLARSGCSTQDFINEENADGDNFFCAPSGDQLAGVFKQAVLQLTEEIRLVHLPQ